MGKAHPTVAHSAPCKVCRRPAWADDAHPRPRRKGPGNILRWASIDWGISHLCFTTCRSYNLNVPQPLVVWQGWGARNVQSPARET